MRKLILLLGVAVLAWPVAARAQARNNDVQGFGGVTVGTSTFGSAASPTFGGRVGVGLTDHIQLVGEAGRLADLSSPVFDLLDFTDVGVRVSAFYGEGGVRFIVSPHGAVRPYAEATAGFARLNAGISGIGGTAGAIANTALNVLNRTQPMLGIGGGLMVQGGPVSVDLGYRYKKISGGDALSTLLSAGNDGYQVNQVRVGIGFRF
jgi:Outer membrane protein beta-barrel domain